MMHLGCSDFFLLDCCKKRIVGPRTPASLQDGGARRCGGVGFYSPQLPSPTLPAGARRAHMAAKRGSGQLGLICMENKVWRGKSQGVMLVREAARGPGAG